MTSHVAKLIAGKALYGVVCLFAAVLLVVAGYAHKVVGQVEDTGKGITIKGSPSVGAMNILVMGLESRTNYEGQTLPGDLLAAMHAGSVNGVNNEGVGSQDTNTLILIHIFAGGKKAVGFSIPRDDWVNFPKAYDGQSVGKIDQAYGLAYAQSLNQTANSTMSHQQRYLNANEAGQAATIATVESVTGEQIDHFSEVNLAGFFELAAAFGGIEVCLKSWNGGQNLHDANSGFNLAAPGYHLLQADQALAFVRERDNLPNGDIDRTRRQQAVIDYVIWKMGHEGILTDLGQLTSLLDVAKKYVITDQDWQILDFATEMHALTGQNLQFETLPIVDFQTFYVGSTAEDANVINVPAIKAEVNKAFTAVPASPSSASKAKPAPKPTKTTVSYPASETTVDVYNAGYASGLAGQAMSALVSEGYRQGQTGDAATRQTATQVLYGSGAGAQSNGAKIAAQFGVTAQASGSVSAGAVEVIIGSGTTTLPSALTAGSSGSAGTSPPATSPSVTTTPNATHNNTNTPLHVGANAKFGIPCVY